MRTTSTPWSRHSADDAVGVGAAVQQEAVVGDPDLGAGGLRGGGAGGRQHGGEQGGEDEAGLRLMAPRNAIVRRSVREKRSIAARPGV